MAVVSKWISPGVATLATPGTSVAANVPTPDNCHTVIFLNESTARFLVNVGSPGGPLPVESTPIPALSALTLGLGSLTERGGQSAGGELIFDANLAASLSITFINGSKA